LESLFVVEKQHRRALDAGYQSLAAGQPRRAFVIADGARALLDDSETRRLVAISALMGRDFNLAWRIYQSCAD
jgi:hypothetical protein